MFNIERNASLKAPGPKDSNAMGRISWPWKDMNVGDLVKIDDVKIIHKARANCNIYGNPIGKKFTARTIDGVLHVWRVK